MSLTPLARPQVYGSAFQAQKATADRNVTAEVCTTQVRAQQLSVSGTATVVMTGSVPGAVEWQEVGTGRIGDRRDCLAVQEVAWWTVRTEETWGRRDFLAVQEVQQAPAI